MAVTITVREATGPSVKAASDELILYLVRHGYGTHNAFAAKFAVPCGCRSGGECAYINPAHRDARLVEKGRRQAVAAGCTLRSLTPSPAIVYVSPLRRTLETAAIAVGGGSGGTGPTLGVPLVAAELLREVYGVHHCDWRGPIADARAEWPAVDYTGVGTDADTWHQEEVRETVDEAAARATRFLLSLRDRPERVVVAVTHSAFLREMLTHAVEVEAGHDGVRRRFETGEVRPVVVSYRGA